MTTIAALRAGDLVRVEVKSRGRAAHHVVARFETVDADTGLVVLRPIDRTGHRLYLDEAEIRSVERIDAEGAAR